MSGVAYLKLTWKATGPLRDRGRDGDTQRDGNRERWRQVERDREKETDPCTERRGRTESSGGDRERDRGEGSYVGTAGPKETVERSDRSSGLGGEPALRMCGPKQLEGAGEPDSRTQVEVAVGSGGTVAWGDRAGGVRGCPGEGGWAGL